MIYYLIRPPLFAAVETDERRVRLEAQGYERVEEWRFVYYWLLRDLRAYARMRGPAQPQERAVGDALDLLYPPPRLFWQRHR